MFLDIIISQGSVATPLRCDEICNDLSIANFLLSVTVKECLKMVLLCEISTIYTAYFFEPPCICSRYLNVTDGRTDRQTGRQTDRQTDRRTDDLR